MEKTLKRQQRTVGAIVKIELEDGYHTYCRILETGGAFYDCRTNVDLEIDTILKSPVLFVICFYSDIITRGIWQKVSKAILPIEEHILEMYNRQMYRQDVFTNKYYIIENGRDKEITKAEAIGLEPFVIWDYKNVEERLNDHFADRFNFFTYHSLNANLNEGFFNEPLHKNEKVSY